MLRTVLVMGRCWRHEKQEFTGIRKNLRTPPFLPLEQVSLLNVLTFPLTVLVFGGKVRESIVPHSDLLGLSSLENVSSHFGFILLSPLTSHLTPTSHSWPPHLMNRFDKISLFNKCSDYHWFHVRFYLVHFIYTEETRGNDYYIKDPLLHV